MVFSRIDQKTGVPKRQPRYDMDHNDLFAKFMDVAEDWEADILENIAVRTGLWWRCETKTDSRPDGCGWINGAVDTQCGGCGAKRENP
jgi:hypothetical protein